jgi:hypothetical protein
MHLVHGPFVSASCVFSTSTEGNTPRGVPHRVQSNVDAAETPSDGLMPQSHLATLTSFPGAAHHMCTVPLCIFYAFLCTSMHFHAFSMHFFNTNVSCTGRSFPPSHDRQVKKTIPTKLCVFVRVSCFPLLGFHVFPADTGCTGPKENLRPPPMF